MRLLAVDNEAVVPVNKVVRLQVTATDVIHSFVVQSFGVRIDAVPGRLNETWFKAERKASTTASARRSAARITPSCRSPSASSARTKYDAWLADAKKKFAAAPSAIPSRPRRRAERQ